MAHSLIDFWNLLRGSPALAAAVLAVVAAMFVNGWTDAPNAVASCPATRALSPKQALGLAVVMNFFGVLAMSFVSSTIAMSVIRIADFGGNTAETLSALAAGMTAAVLWPAAAGLIGLPVSKSHALFSGITGAAVALEGNFTAVSGGEWGRLLAGMLLSVAVGFGGSYLIARVTEICCRRVDRLASASFFRGAQICSSAAIAFLHGAQDGQKYMGAVMLAVFLSQGTVPPERATLPVWLIILTSLVIAAGTSFGGWRIVRSLGFQLARMEPYHGFAADTAAVLSLLFSTLAGYPVSTTHTKTAAIMGAGLSRGVLALNWRVVLRILSAWLLTFPGCGLVGFVLALVFRMI